MKCDWVRHKGYKEDGDEICEILCFVWLRGATEYVGEFRKEGIG